MTINSVTSNRALYDAMVQQAAALRAAPDNRALASRTSPVQASQGSPAKSSVSESPEATNFATSLSAHTRAIESRPPTLPPPARPEARPLKNRVADLYRGPAADANRLVVQTRAPGTLAAPGSSAASVAPAVPPEDSSPDPTFVEVHSVYVDASDEESGRRSRNPLFQFASQLYQNVVTTSRRSAAGEFIGSSFSAVA